MEGMVVPFLPFLVFVSCSLALHCYVDGMLSWRVGEQVPFQRLSVKCDGGDALVVSVGVDGDGVVGVTESAVDGIVSGGAGQTGVNA